MTIDDTYWQTLAITWRAFTPKNNRQYSSAFAFDHQLEPFELIPNTIGSLSHMAELPLQANSKLLNYLGQHVQESMWHRSKL